jgi:hypothetical protein
MRQTVSLSSRLPTLGPNKCILTQDADLHFRGHRPYDFRSRIASTEFVDSSADAGTTASLNLGQRARKDAESQTDGQEYPRRSRRVCHWRWGPEVSGIKGTGAEAGLDHDA